MCRLLAESVLLLAAARIPAAAADDILIKSSGTWNATSTAIWGTSAVPTFGPGSSVAFGTSAAEYFYLGTNVTIGALTVPASVTPASGASYQAYPSRVRRTETVDPTYGSYKWFDPGYTLTLDSGTDEPAVIGGLVAIQANRYRMYVHVPIRMASDLTVTHRGFLGEPGGSSGGGEHVSLGMLGDISDDGSPHTLVTDGPWYLSGTNWRAPSVVLGGKNTFTGDVDVRAWTRLFNREGLHGEGSGTQLGRDNGVYATNDWAILDLAGNVYTADHHLYLSGYTVQTNTVGRLASMYSTPHATAVWRGPVTLLGSTAIGGCLGYYPLGSYGSEIRIEGDIDDAAGTSSLTLLGTRSKAISGNVDLGGRLVSRGGELSLAGATGLKPQVLQLADAAVYRMTSADDPDLSRIIYTNTVAYHTIRLCLDGDFTFTPQCGFTNFTYFYKTGRGTLVWDKNNRSLGSYGSGNFHMDFYSFDGDSVFDYTVNDTARLHGHTFYDTIGVGNGGRVILKTKANAKAICDWVCTDWSTGEIVKEGPALVDAANVTRDGISPLNFVVRDGTLTAEPGRLAMNTTTAPNTWGEANFWDGRTWITSSTWYDGYRRRMAPFTAYTNDWTKGTCFIDMTSAFASSAVPANSQSAAWRFDTPPESGNVLTVNLSGKHAITSGTILITPGFGTGKTLRIKGGSLTRPSAGTFRIVSYATNTTVEIASDFVQTDRTKPVGLGIFNCTVYFTGNSEFNGSVGVVGGLLDVRDNRFMGSPTRSGGTDVETTRYIVFNQGGVLRTHGDFTLQRDVNSVAIVPYFLVKSGVGKLDVADGTLTSGAKKINAECDDMATFEKGGAGHFLIANAMGRTCNALYRATDKVMRYAFTGGRVTLNGAVNAYSEEMTEITVSNGVTVAGAYAFASNAGGSNGGGYIADGGSRMAYRIGPGGVVFDLAGTSRAVGTSGGDLSGYETHPSGDFYLGEGDIAITNSSTTSAWYKPRGMGISRFTGNFRNHAPQTSLTSDNGGAFLMPNGVFEIPAGKSPYFHQLADGYQDLWLGRLAGSGTLQVQARNTYADPVLYLGRNAEETSTFDGKLSVTARALNNHASARIVKIGTSALRLTNPAGTVQGATRIADGDILIACEPTGSQAGALGNQAVYLCDDKTPENAAPRLMTEGPYTFNNAFRILAKGAASASPALGGLSETEDSTFTGTVQLWRDLTLHSAGGTVTFAGQFSNGDGNPHVLAKTGPGTVIVKKSVPTVSGLLLAGGTLQFDTAYTVPAGATVSIDEGLCVDENIDKTLQLLSTPYGMTGEFALATELPDGWVVRQKSTGLTLSWGRRGSVIIIR